MNDHIIGETMPPPNSIMKGVNLDKLKVKTERLCSFSNQCHNWVCYSSLRKWLKILPSFTCVFKEKYTMIL